MPPGSRAPIRTWGRRRFLERRAPTDQLELGLAGAEACRAYHGSRCGQDSRVASPTDWRRVVRMQRRGLGDLEYRLEGSPMRRVRICPWPINGWSRMHQTAISNIRLNHPARAGRPSEQQLDANILMIIAKKRCAGLEYEGCPDGTATIRDGRSSVPTEKGRSCTREPSRSMRSLD